MIDEGDRLPFRSRRSIARRFKGNDIFSAPRSNQPDVTNRIVRGSPGNLENPSARYPGLVYSAVVTRLLFHQEENVNIIVADITRQDNPPSGGAAAAINDNL